MPIIALLALSTRVALSEAAPPPSLGHAAYFSVLAGQAILNRGASSIYGNAAVSPGSSIEGLKMGVLKGYYEARTEAARMAEDSLRTAMQAADDTPCEKNISKNISELTLYPGVYCSDSDLTLSNTLTLDGLGNSDSVFLFKVGADLRALPMSKVEVVNGANPCNVYWKLGGRALLETESAFAGNIMARTSIVMEHGALLTGRTLARQGRILLNKNQIEACPAPTLSTEGRMVGNGRFQSGGRDIFSSFELQCVPLNPQSLEISQGEKNLFRMVSLTTVTCIDDPSILPNPSPLGFDWMRGAGTGYYKGRPGHSASWTFTDLDDSGRMDYAELIIRNKGGRAVWSASGYLTQGNHQTFRDLREGPIPHPTFEQQILIKREP